MEPENRNLHAYGHDEVKEVLALRGAQNARLHGSEQIKMNRIGINGVQAIEHKGKVECNINRFAINLTNKILLSVANVLRVGEQGYHAGFGIDANLYRGNLIAEQRNTTNRISKRMS